MMAVVLFADGINQRLSVCAGKIANLKLDAARASFSQICSCDFYFSSASFGSNKCVKNNSNNSMFVIGDDERNILNFIQKWKLHMFLKFIVRIFWKFRWNCLVIFDIS